MFIFVSVKAVKYILQSLILFAQTYLFAQDPYYIHINSNKKLPSNNVYSIFQDKSGFIWVSHEEGLSRYDGLEFKTYTCPEQTSKAGSDIKEDSFGRIWYENFDGYLYYVKNDTMHAFLKPLSVGYQHYTIIKDRLLLLQKGGLEIYDLQSMQTLKRIPLQTDSISNIFGSKQHLYVLGQNVIKINYDGQVDTLDFGNKPTQLYSHAVFNGDTMLLYDIFNQSQTVLEYYNGKVREFKNFETGNTLQAAAFTDSIFWFCSSNGVWALNQNGKLLNNKRPYFSGSNISSAFKDREGNYWFGTTNNGIYFVPDLGIKIWLPGYSVKKMVSHKNNLFVGTNSDGILSFSQKTGQLTSLYQGNSGKEVIFLYYDSLDSKLLFTSTHFFIINDRGEIISKNVLPLKDCRRINKKHFAFASSGLSGTFCTDTLIKDEWDRNGIATRNLQHLYLDISLEFIRAKSVAWNARNNQVYYATNAGLFTQKANQLPHEIFFGNKKIYCSRLQQYADYITALNSNGTLLELQGNEIVKEIDHAEYRFAKILNIKTAGRFLFLICPGTILYRDLEKSDRNFYPLNINLSENEINDVEWKDGKLLIATNKGIAVYKLQNETLQRDDPRFIITSVKINDNTVDMALRQEYEYRQNNVEINFSLLYFKAPGRMPLYYKINQSGWEKINPGQRQLKLAALAPGDYHIRFHTGEINQTFFPDKEIRFVIKKAWWLTWWAYALYVLLSASIFYSIYLWQTRLLKKQNQLLDQKVKLETALRKSILKSIKAQMNPHFFYNALNTVQSFIYSEDKKNASAYLNRFSKLTRLILEMSEKESVSLAEEKEALELYLEIEKARFEKDFEYSILLPNQPAAEQIFIPPMLIQPYVENAIKHGLLHKKGQKKLQLLFSLMAGYLEVSIDDNGVGRKLSAGINERKTGKPRSFSSEANQTRFKLMENENLISKVEIVDKSNEYGISKGTLVKLVIPVSLTQK